MGRTGQRGRPIRKFTFPSSFSKVSRRGILAGTFAAAYAAMSGDTQAEVPPAASGTRVLRRTTSSSGTTMTIYAFGAEDHNYTTSGSHTSDLYYYSVGRRLIGSLDNPSDNEDSMIQAILLKTI